MPAFGKVNFLSLFFAPSVPLCRPRHAGYTGGPPFPPPRSYLARLSPGKTHRCFSLYPLAAAHPSDHPTAHPNHPPPPLPFTILRFVILLIKCRNSALCVSQGIMILIIRRDSFVRSFERVPMRKAIINRMLINSKRR